MVEIKLESISKYMDRRPVLQDIDLEIVKGTRLVLLGPSGCGKTTLLRLIAGFIAPDEGKIYLSCTMVSRKREVVVPPEKRGIGFVFQDLALWPHMNVYKNLEFVLKAQKVPRAKRAERIKKMLDMVGLGDLSSRMPAQLSGGQQQRVALARALVSRPAIVLMDEPLSSLDWDLKAQLAKRICELQEEIGFTMVYVTHDREETRQLATRVAIMKGGKIEKIDGGQTS